MADDVFEAARPSGDAAADSGPVAGAQAAVLDPFEAARPGGPQAQAAPTSGKPSYAAEFYNPLVDTAKRAMTGLHSAATGVENFIADKTGLGAATAAADTAELARRQAADAKNTAANPSSASPPIGQISSVEDAARWALSTSGSLAAALAQLSAMGIPRAAALAALEGFTETKDQGGSNTQALGTAGVEAAAQSVPLHLLGKPLGSVAGSVATAAGMGASNVASEAATRAIRGQEPMTGEEMADAAARGAAMIGIHDTVRRVLAGKPAPAVPVEPEAPAEPPQLLLPPPGGGPMTDEQIAQTRARMRSDDRAVYGQTRLDADGKPYTVPPPTNDTLITPTDRAPQDRDQVDAQRQAEQAFKLAEMQRARAGADVADTQPGGRPEGQDQQAVVIDNGFPVQVAARFHETDEKGRPVEMATVQRYDPRTGKPEDGSTPYNVPVSRLTTASYAVDPRRSQDFVERADSPAGDKLGLDEQTYRTTPPDPNQEFPGATSGDQPRPGEAQGRTPLPEQPPGEAPGPRFSPSEQAQRDAEERQARDSKASFADAEKRYADAEATSKAAAPDENGRYTVDADGFVKSTKDGPIRFMSQREAGKWILKEGQAKSPDQIFERANYPGKSGFTVRETGRSEQPVDKRGEPGTALPPPEGARQPEPAQQPERPVSSTPPEKPPVKETKKSKAAAKAPVSSTPPGTPPVKEFDPIDHAPRAMRVVEKSDTQLTGKAFGKALGLTPEQGLRMLQYLAARPDTGVFMTRKSGKFRRAIRTSGPADIVQFLARMGGIYDEQGELKDHQAFVPGAGLLVRPKGSVDKNGRRAMELDDARALALEAGYLTEEGHPDLPATSSTNALIEAIRSTNFGKKVFSARDVNDVLDKQQEVGADRDRHDMEQRADELGIHYDQKTTADELRKAIYAEEEKLIRDKEDSARGDSWSETPPDERHDEFDIPFFEKHAENKNPGTSPGVGDSAASHPDETSGASQRADEGQAPRGDRGGALPGDLRDPEALAGKGGGNLNSDLFRFLKAEGASPNDAPGFISKITDWLRQVGRATKNESGVMYDHRLGLVRNAHTDGQKHTVTFRVKENGAWNGSNRLTFFHNHPNGSAISWNDVIPLALPGLRWIAAVTHDGHFSAAKLTDRMRRILRVPDAGETTTAKYNETTRFLAKIGGNAFDKLERAMNAAAHESPTKGEAEALASSEILSQALAHKGVIDYVSSHTVDWTPTARKMFGAAISSIRDDLETANITALGNDNVSRYQPPTPVSPAEGIARVIKSAGGADPSGEKATGSPGGNPVAPAAAKAPPLEPGVKQGRLFEQKRPGIDLTDQGEQRVLPGAERLTDKEVAERQMAQKMKPKVGQKPANEGLFGAKPDEIPQQATLFETRAQVKQREESYDQNTKESMTRWAGPRDDRSVYDKIKDNVAGVNRGTYDELYQKAVDRRYSPAEREAIRRGYYKPEDLSPEGHLKATVSAGIAAMWADRSGSFAEKVLNTGQLIYDGMGTVVRPFLDRSGQEVKGWMGIMDPIGTRGLWREYSTYARIIRAQRLFAEGKDKQFVAARDLPALRDLEKKYPFFRDVHAEEQRLNKANLQYLVQTGRFSQAKADEFSKHGDYTAFYRNLLEESGVRGPSHVDSLANDRSFRKISGGDAQIGEFIGNSVRNIQSIAAVGLKNIAAQRYIRDALMVGWATQLRGNPIELEKAPGVVRIYENGQAKYYRVGDKLTYNALQGLDGHPLNPFIKMLGIPAQVLRTMTTHSPLFLLVNHPMRESMQAWFVNKTFVPPIVSAVRGILDVVRHGDLTEQVTRHGVGGGFDLVGGEDAASRAVRKNYAEASTSFGKMVKAVTDGYGRLVDAADLGVRTQIYDAEMKRLGDTPGAEHIAAAAAMRNAVNFKQRGSSEALRWMTTMIPFLNARIQGLDTLGRSFSKERRGLTMTKALGLVALTGAYYAWVNQNPLYQRASDQQKDENWLIPVGNNAMFRMPAPFEIGILFKRIPERIMRLLAGDDMLRDTTGALSRAVLDTLKFNPVPQAFLPVGEALVNYSSYTGKPIENGSMAGRSAPMRYDAQTSEVAKAAGALTNTSPQRIDHVLKGYFGTGGGYALAAIDALTRAVKDGPSQPSKGFTGLPGVSSLIKTANNQGSAQVEQFYEIKTEVDQLVHDLTMLKGDPEGYKTRLAEGKQLLQVKGYTQNVGHALTQIHKAETAIRGGTLSPDEKQAKLEKLDAQRQGLLKNVGDMRRRAYGS